MSSDRLPDRDHLIGLAGTTASSTAVLAMGFAIGVIWAGTSVQSTGCVTPAGPVGACRILPTLEHAGTYALFVVLVGFVVAFGAECRSQNTDSEDSGETGENQ